MATPHLDKLNAAMVNPKCSAEDRKLLEEARELYDQWVADMGSLTSQGKERVVALVNLLNRYKDALEVDLIMKRGSTFLKRQKGQLKLDNSVLEEFLIYLVHPDIIEGLGDVHYLIGPQTAFMSISFRPSGWDKIDKRPELALKLKDQDFVIGTRIHYKFAPAPDFPSANTTSGSFVLAVLAAECKVNLDKTMYQEAAGTASRLKMGCPIAKYFVLAEYLDMIPEDPRLTDIDNVFLLRHAERLPVNRRHNIEAVEAQHKNHPIDPGVIWLLVEHIQNFVNASWYDPDGALARGSFI